MARKGAPDGQMAMRSGLWLFSCRNGPIRPVETRRSRSIRVSYTSWLIVHGLLQFLTDGPCDWALFLLLSLPL